MKTTSNGIARWWLVGLLGRFALILASGIFLVWLTRRVLLRFSPHALWGWITTILILGYGWAIYWELPFFRLRSKGQRVLISLALALLPLLATFGCILMVLAQLFQDFRRAHFASPANSAYEIWFYDGGFRKRDLFLYAKQKGQKPQFVSNLVFPYARLAWPLTGTFSGVQWTKDGQIAVCIWNGRNFSDAPVLAAAFDFHENKALTPPGMTSISSFPITESDWKKQRSIVQGIVDAHGGLSDLRIDDDMIQKNEKKLWFWQTLPDS